MNRETRKCQNCHQEFRVEPEDFGFYEKIKVPVPTWCPDCRLIRRFQYLNERTLYRRKCDLCGKGIISMYAPEIPYVVYCQKCWFSDDWDSLSYGREYDFSKSFLEQFDGLLKRTPIPALLSYYETLVNSEYTNFVGNLKNCYLLFNSDYDQDCAYGNEIESSKDCYDNLMIDSCEIAAENVNCQKCYRTFWCRDSENSRDIWFSKNLSGCSDCFGCVNLRNKQHCIFNQQYSKDEYREQFLKFNVGSYSMCLGYLKKLREMELKFPVKFIHGRQNTGVSGDYIFHSKNTKNSYLMTETQDCRYCFSILVPSAKGCWDNTGYGEGAERVYEAVNCGGGVADVYFSFLTFLNCLDVRYSGFIFGSHHIFGGVSLRKKEYCILNKQYTENEYRELVAKILEHMDSNPYIDSKGRVYRYGEFFPAELSPHSYNEGVGQQFSPLAKEEAIGRGFKWKEISRRDYEIDVPPSEIPDDIKEVQDNILNQVIGCMHGGLCNEQCNGAFRVIPQELEFRKRVGLPLPRLCSNCRHYERLKLRTPLRSSLYRFKCRCAGMKSENDLYKNTAPHSHGDSHCPNEFETSYAPDRPEIVYCEACYNAEVV